MGLDAILKEIQSVYEKVSVKYKEGTWLVVTCEGVVGIYAKREDAIPLIKALQEVNMLYCVGRDNTDIAA